MKPRRARGSAVLLWMMAVPVLLAGRPAFADDLPKCDPAQAPYKDWLRARRLMTGFTARSADKYLMATATAADDCDGTVDLSLNQSGRFDDGIHAWIAAG